MLNSHANLKDTIMKRLTVILAMALIAISAGAQTPKNVKYAYTEASDLNLIGKIIDTPNPYHRVDTVRYKGFTKGENEQVRSSAGLAVLFKTNSSVISVLADYGYMNRATNTMGISLRGYDLYIKKDGEWLYAASKAAGNGKEEDNLVIIKDMDDTGVDKAMLDCSCILCGAPATKVSEWRFSGSSFHAIYKCGPCNQKYRVNVQFKRQYNQVVSKKTVLKIKDKKKKKA